MNKYSGRSILHGIGTPLASIFGSGFLVIVPILGGTVGKYSVIAMAVICALAYAVGSVIRYNIRNAEQKLQTGEASVFAKLSEKTADIALVLAYVISVTLYLRILASYALGFFSADTEANQKILTTAIIAAILLIAVTKGLSILERLENLALIITLAIIALLITAFGLYDVSAFTNNTLALPKPPTASPWEITTIMAGTLIVVQGFETTRYLGGEFDVETRVRACRNSQIFSAIIYLVFISVATPLMRFLPSGVSDNVLLHLVGIVAIWLPIPLVLAAIFSQFSAAIADAIGGAGNSIELSNQKISEKASYVMICGLSIGLCWVAETMEILAFASRAFAFYYLLQCFVAISVSRKKSEKLGFGLIAGMLGFITIFAVPVG